jgi:hypothetical protein
MTQVATRSPLDVYVIATLGGRDRAVRRTFGTTGVAALRHALRRRIALGGDRPAVTPTSSELTAAGAIMQIG